MFEQEEDYTYENQEMEATLIKTPPTMTHDSYTKISTRMLRNPHYQAWRGTSRGSVADFLFGFTIRRKCGNAIADMLYDKYYVGKRLLVARFTQDGLAKLLGYKDRKSINKQMKLLEKEGIFKVHMEPWRGKKIRVYEFGYWENKTGTDYVEVLHFFCKFNKMLADEQLSR